ncbi:GNAT family N-acetyltransferase [Leekyejoonella antrihumi]|uniref:GNAT family N-acetyltransferase n=1 Tax=Leekyejoonella antrihumi TaxID=1660198 RepID=UPI001C941C39|nr:GNAT family N-acetyltransferase [Leekyejoonella antrihumi]
MNDLVELRAEMFRAMGTADVDNSGWRRSAQDWFRGHVESAAVHIVVVEVEARVVSTAMATIRDSAPSPSCPAGGDVLISNVCTLPAARRRGHGQLAFTAVLAWARSTGVARAELMATGEGRAMYESAGFTATAHPAMRMPLLLQPG